MRQLFFFPQQLIVANNALYFAAIIGTNHFEFYKVDLSDVLTKIDVYPGGISSIPFALIAAAETCISPPRRALPPAFHCSGWTASRPCCSPPITPRSCHSETPHSIGSLRSRRSACCPRERSSYHLEKPDLPVHFFDYELGVYDGVNPLTIINIFPGMTLWRTTSRRSRLRSLRLAARCFSGPTVATAMADELGFRTGRPLERILSGTSILVPPNLILTAARQRGNWRGNDVRSARHRRRHVLPRRQRRKRAGTVAHRRTVGNMFMLKDIRPGGAASWSIPRLFTDVGGTLYSVADDGNGQEYGNRMGPNPIRLRVTDIARIRSAHFQTAL